MKELMHLGTKLLDNRYPSVANDDRALSLALPCTREQLSSHTDSLNIKVKPIKITLSSPADSLNIKVKAIKITLSSHAD